MTYCESNVIINEEAAFNYRALNVGSHEILHAVWNLYYLQNNEEEEKAVSRISTGLIGLFDDPRNAKVMSFLMDSANDRPTTKNK